MTLAEIVGKNISERRRALGISQKELAIRLDITQDALNRMEKGHIAPKMSRLSEIAAQLNCAVPTLFHSGLSPLHARAAAIADILATVPEPSQEALVNLIAEAARAINITKK